METSERSLNRTHLYFKRLDVVDVDVSVSQSVNKVAGLMGQN